MKLYPDSIIILSKNFNFLTYINLFYYLFFYIYSLHSVKNLLVFFLKSSISHKITKIYSKISTLKASTCFFTIFTYALQKSKIPIDLLFSLPYRIFFFEIFNSIFPISVNTMSQ